MKKITGPGLAIFSCVTVFCVNMAVAADVAPGPKATFTDITGIDGEQQIMDDVKIGAIENGPKFNPNASITRAQFLRWEVKANNYLRSKKRIRLANPGTPSSFPDVPNTHPDFPYIQGAADAGFAVGFKDGTFKPNEPLSREQMIAIKTNIDCNGQYKYTDPDKLPDDRWQWTDAGQVSKEFKAALYQDFEEDSHFCNSNRVFGNTKVLHPQQKVTRADAAICIWQQRGHCAPDRKVADGFAYFYNEN